LDETVMWMSGGGETMCETDNETRGRNRVYETVKRKEMSPVYSSVYPRLNRNNSFPGAENLNSLLLVVVVLSFGWSIAEKQIDALGS
jgi:hypothetical protein